MYLASPAARYAPNLYRRRRFLGTVEQSATTGAASVGAAAASAAIHAASIGASVGASAAIGAATAGIGAAIGIILALFAAHQARVAGAKNENAAVNLAVPNAQSELQQIVSLYNSGQLTASLAAQYVAQVAANFQAAIAQYQTGAGQHSIACVAGSSVNSKTGSWASTPCNKNCTAGCCVYCNTILQWVSAVTQAITAGGGTAQMGGITGDAKYAGMNLPAWTLNVTPPAPGSVAGVTSDLTEVAADITSGATVAGIPVWAIALLGAGALYAFL